MTEKETKNKLIALLGQQQALADGVVDYCTKLKQAMEGKNVQLTLQWVPWKEQGWLRALTWLWQESESWYGQWVIVQYTAAAWSELALPILFIVVLQLLRIRQIRVAIMFHEVQGYPGNNLKAKIRSAIQVWTIRTAIGMSDRSIFNVDLEQLTWLPVASSQCTFIPVGSNMPELDLMTVKSKEVPSQRHTKTVVVFGMTSVDITGDEVEAIAAAMSQTAKHIDSLCLVTLGRGSKEAELELREALKDTNVEISVLGLLKPEEITQALMEADVMLFVRGEICSRKTTAIAGLSCGLPIVAYQDTETAHPIPEAGVLLVPTGDLQGLASALTQVLQDDKLWLDLHQRSLHIYQSHFAWDVIAQRFMETLKP
ncbi:MULTISPECIES: glycosyltransferase [unclassified Roseofilum]|uniref:glycosyltransferase n=1 Tax=unclassified Roseofilum TaxID=2620099 RepID=UPI000E83E17D|nr:MULTISPECIES: glycosyltransferase [unclassified Roseofilum]MBP0010127.1 glycosyltransferase [Roseofilum sp. Belize Diploria]MBP0032066.1 glycosyltransferase [Roseofilum sp. Belize BBD 4]HBQ98139.1 hypothetical protein [Cyanobacteria bacterium UBA11691]